MTKGRFPATAAIRHLREHGANFTLHPYKYVDGGGTETAARELGTEEHVTIKTIVMEDERKSAFIVLMHGDKQISTREMARIRDAKAVVSCDPKVVLRLTGYMVGGTSPFGAKKPLPVYMEETIADLPLIYINAGRRGLLAAIAPGELIRILKPTLVKVGR